jgi:hypothetical protein
MISAIETDVSNPIRTLGGTEAPPKRSASSAARETATGSRGVAAISTSAMRRMRVRAVMAAPVRWVRHPGTKQAPCHAGESL